MSEEKWAVCRKGRSACSVSSDESSLTHHPLLGQHRVVLQQDDLRTKLAADGTRQSNVRRSKALASVVNSRMCWSQRCCGCLQ